MSVVRERAGRLAHAVALVGTLGPAPTAVSAAPSSTVPAAPRSTVPADAPRTAYPTLPPLGTYARLLAGAGLGRGIRLNNPYRLSTELGGGPESLSLAATYLDAWAGATLGGPDGFGHGIAVHGAWAIDGIAQQVVTPSYLLWWEPHPRIGVLARAGLPVVVGPDVNVGYELAVGAAYWLSASFGVSSELIGNVYYGAATPDAGVTVIPLLSLGVGGVFRYEVLP